MRGVICCTFDFKAVYNSSNFRSGNFNLVVCSKNELTKRNNRMFAFCFVQNLDLDCYVVDGFGAWMENIYSN